MATGESPNNDLTGQTNRARLYKGRPNIYGQCRVFPDLIQEALFEFVDNNKQLTEWFEGRLRPVHHLLDPLLGIEPRQPGGSQFCDL
ncbi:Uncharacterised protein [Klebsiella pneumoniae]|uniref:Uncharacterized protein n=1 Tax=Klebsiella pneumoniae TaxID=573 RepID=A0A378F3R4_KLEPN|nr:Uncharacterised protein [Klebsiella pneumoniae]